MRPRISISRFVYPSVGRSVCRSVGRSVARSRGRTVGRSVVRSVSRSIGRSVSRLVGRLAVWSVDSSTHRVSCAVNRTSDRTVGHVFVVLNVNSNDCDRRSQLTLSPGWNNDRPTDRPTDRGRGHTPGAGQNVDVNEDSHTWMPRTLFWRDIASSKC